MNTIIIFVSDNTKYIPDLLKRRMDNGKNSPFTCPRCTRLYNHKSNLMRHLRLECGVGPQFQCFVCQRKFKHRHHLTDHMRTHPNPIATFPQIEFQPQPTEFQPQPTEFKAVPDEFQQQQNY